jgi:hypothetical protein
MNSQVEVRPDELVAHAATVTAIGDRVAATAAAGRAVRPGADAYGRLCALVPSMLGALQDVLVDGIASAAGSLHDTAGRLRTTAAGYASTDQRRAESFDGIRAGP